LGVNLTPIVEKRVVTLEDLRGRSFAVDGFVVIHQFLALIRARDGQPLMDTKGRTTSHLVGLAFRTTRLIADYGMKLIFVFDGRPPQLKRTEVEKRREVRAKFEGEYREAIAAGDYKAAMSKAVMTGRITGEGIADAKRLLDLLGIPWVQAPSEGEAQAAYMAAKGDVWASNSQDARARILEQLTPDIPAIRDLYSHPPASDNYTLDEKPVQEEALKRFLCDERSFSRERVDTVIARMRNARSQRSLRDWYGGV